MEKKLDNNLENFKNNLIANQLKILLKELNMTQRQFAAKISLDPGYFSRIMQGKVNVPDRLLLLIETLFNVNRNWLVKGEGEMFTSGISLIKKQVIELIDTLTDDQIEAVSSFIKYLNDQKE